MTFKLIQIVLLGGIALMILHAIAQYRRSDIGLLQLVAWLAIWSAGALVVVFHESATAFANSLGVGRGADLVMYVSIPILFYAVFRLRIRTERLSRELTDVTRELALETRRREDAERASKT